MATQSAVPESEPLSQLEIAFRFSRQAKRNAPVRYGFIQRATASEPAPPAIAVLRGATGSRAVAGGDIRLRLLLSLLWAVHDDPTLTYPYRAWAALLGLEDPEAAGARRIRTALRSLARLDLLQLDSAPGRDAAVHLLEDTRSGDRYELPGAAYTRLKSKPAKAAPHRYIQLPGQLWTNGWIKELTSGPALVMLLVLWLESGREVKSSQPPWVWLSPSMAEQRYGLSEDTRLKGARELAKLGLVKISTRHVPGDAFEFRRGRHSYQIQRTRIMTVRPGDAEQHAFFRGAAPPLKPLFPQSTD
ncbi:hypothetical protein [Amycolatopsis sp. NPDC052450]|uniref:hypothetical protein n=1 Tax=Amycolatopsis sp. NPDC052450 TaxID=3363937 RepID=UPI0037C537EA